MAFNISRRPREINHIGVDTDVMLKTLFDINMFLKWLKFSLFNIENYEKCLILREFNSRPKPYDNSFNIFYNLCDKFL